MSNFVLRGKDSRTNRDWHIKLDTLETGETRGKRLFRGRPTLVVRLLPALEARVTGLSKASAKHQIAMLHSFWHFLDHLETLSEAMPHVGRITIEDLSWNDLEKAWRQFIDWLR